MVYFELLLVLDDDLALASLLLVLLLHVVESLGIDQLQAGDAHLSLLLLLLVQLDPLLLFLLTLDPDEFLLLLPALFGLQDERLPVVLCIL